MEKIIVAICNQELYLDTVEHVLEEVKNKDYNFCYMEDEYHTIQLVVFTGKIEPTDKELQEYLIS